MRRTSFFTLLVLVISWSCGKGTDTEKVLVDKPIVDSATFKVVIPDPDTTDQITGDQYLINSVSEEIAALVRKRLKLIAADDLKLGIVDSLSRKFIFFEYDLNGDNINEIFVGLTGPYFCGSGGCTQLILDSKGDVITKFTVSDYPVVISGEITNGWKNLYILSDGNYHIARFDGKSYPSNPSVLPELGMTPGDGLPRVLDFLNDNYPWFRF
jgi:hypothetical protein